MIVVVIGHLGVHVVEPGGGTNEYFVVRTSKHMEVCLDKGGVKLGRVIQSCPTNCEGY